MEILKLQQKEVENNYNESFDIVKDKLFDELFGESSVSINPLSVYLVGYKEITKKHEFLVFCDDVKD